MIISSFRIGRLGRLTVHSLAEEPASPKTKISAVGFSVMTLGNSTEFYVSGVPAEYEVRFLILLNVQTLYFSMMSEA